MKRTLLALSVLVGLGLVGINTVFAASPYDWTWTLNDGSSTPYSYDMQGDFGTPDQHLIYIDPSTHLPVPIRIQTGMDITSDAGGPFFEINGIQESQTQNLVSDLAGKSAVGHTHSVGDITGLGSFVDSRVAAASTQSDWTATSTSSQSYIKHKPALSFATSTRSLNTAFQISAGSAVFVSYSVDVASTLTLITGQTGTVILEYADDSGFTTNVVTAQSAVNGNTGTLAIGLNLTQTGTASVSAMIPAGKYVRLRTVNTTGTPTFTYRAGQEVLIPL